MTTKQQFNVYLPKELIRQIKHKAIDADQSLSHLLEKVLTAHLLPQSQAGDNEPQLLTPMPIIYVTDMSQSLAFYEALGFAVHKMGEVWSELRLGTAVLALHKTEQNFANPQRMALAFIANVPLEKVAQQLKAVNVSLPNEIVDEAFGRSLLIYDPDQMPIQINEHDPELTGE